MQPHAEIIPRSPRTEATGNPDLPAAAWADLEKLLLAGAGTTWLSVGREHGVHVRPIFAAWTGTSFVFASNPSAAKSRRLDADGHCSLAIDLGRAHLVVEDRRAADRRREPHPGVHDDAHGLRLDDHGRR